MSATTKKTGKGIIASSIVILLILVVVNLIAVNTINRIDLTENKEFTISQSTRKILGNMDDLVTIKVYFSKDLPAYISSLPRSVRDVLDEFSAYSKGNLQVRWEDPGDSPEDQARLNRLGIRPVQLDVIQKDKREVANVYLGMAIMYEDRHEVIPVVQGPWGLEYELATSILKVTRTETPKIGIISRYERADFDQRYQQMQMVLGKQYEIQFLDLADGKNPIPDDITSLMLVGPKELGEAEQYRIDQFIMGGGRVFAMLDGLDMSDAALQGTRLTSGLEDMMETFGLRLNSDLVVDRISSMASFSSGFIRFMSNYPLWPKIVRQGFDDDHPVVSKLETVTMPWTRSIDMVGTPPDSIEITRMAASSEASWTTTNFSNLNPQQEWNASQEDMKVHGLIYSLNGVFPSHFAGKDIPAVADSGAAPIDGTGRRDESLPTQMIVAGNSYFATDQFLAQFPGNLTFMLNAVDWISMGTELVGIRSRHVSERPLKEISEGHKNALRIIGILLIPVAIVIIGMVRAFAGARVKRIGESEYGGAA